MNTISLSEAKILVRICYPYLGIIRSRTSPYAHSRDERRAKAVAYLMGVNNPDKVPMIRAYLALSNNEPVCEHVAREMRQEVQWLRAKAERYNAKTGVWQIPSLPRIPGPPRKRKSKV